MCIVESKKSFNRWSKLMSVSDRDTVLSTSQFYYPLDVSLYVNALRESKNGLLAIELWPSSKCNHKCTFCSSKQFRSLLDNIWTKERIIRFVNEASDMGVPLIRFSGGLEPF